MRLRIVLTWVLGLVFVAAAIGKSISPTDLALVLRWFVNDAISVNQARGIVGVVVAIEMLIGLRLLMGAPSNKALAVTAAALCVFTLVLLRLALSGDPNAPSCGCLGVIARVRHAQSDAAVGLARNFALLFIAAWLIVQGRSRPAAPVSDGATDGGPRQERAKHGFTLIELLVSIAVIATLIGIVLPSFASTARQSRETVVLADEREAMSTITQYADSNHELFPSLTHDGRPDILATVGGVEIDRSYFATASYFWPNNPALGFDPGFLDHLSMMPRGTEEYAEFLRVNNLPDGVIISRYPITNTAFAEPRFWRPGGPADKFLLRSMKLSGVTFPSSKGILVDISIGAFKTGYPTEDIFAAFADGSASKLRYESVYEIGRPLDRPYGSTPVGIMSTTDGIEGRDR